MTSTPQQTCAADLHDTIKVRGARVNNLKNLDVDVPKRRLTVFTGVSGSGKSSLVFGTIAAESRRLIDETYSAFIQGFIPSLPRPDVDVLENLSPAIIIDQERMGASARSTVGTATDANSMLRLVFSRLSQPYVGTSGHFSFNLPEGMCPTCEGTGEAATLDYSAFLDEAKTLNGGAIIAPGFSDLKEFLDGITDARVKPALDALKNIINAMVEVGLGYLSLSRESGTLSGGEAQRVKMIRHLGSPLTDVTYVFDEPTAGLHPHDIGRMNNLLLKIRDKGNTVLVVEHKPEVISIADNIVDIGPDSGDNGGQLIYTGAPTGLCNTNSITAEYLTKGVILNENPRIPTGQLHIGPVTKNNLEQVSATIPLGVFTVITGVAGSGKSTLIAHGLNAHTDVLTIDQSAIRGSRRSSPATYTGLLDKIRAKFAKDNGVKPALFSANSEGACPVCDGLGVTYMDLAIMAGVSSKCEACGGNRFKEEVLAYTIGKEGYNIADVLNMSVDKALTLFTTGEAKKILQRLTTVGLGYLRLGQPLNTLSGGERQRLKLAAHMTDSASIIVLDEPTTGLHLKDTQTIITMMNTLVNQGKTVVAIEHNVACIAAADHVIDLGPGAGAQGGRIVFTGSPAQLMTSGTLTGQAVKLELTS